MNSKNINQPIQGLCLATRTDASPDYLKAFLDHHLPLCDRAVVLLSRRPSESTSEVRNVLKEYGEKVILADFPEAHFHNGRTCTALSLEVQKDSRNEVILHLDKDEFIQWTDKIPAIVESIRTGESRWAEGRMIDRFSVGGGLIPSNLQSRDAFDRAAPVQSQVTGKYAFPDLKCYLTKASDGVRIHWGDKGWKKDKSGMVIEHYRWTEKSKERSQVKIVQHPHSITTTINTRDLNVLGNTDDFQTKLKEAFRPKSAWLHGWFDYPDLYRVMVERAPAGAVMVEIGVWRGKSLGFLSGYAELLGKELKCIGYDQFDPKYYLGTPGKQAWTSEDWANQVRSDLKENTPARPPAIVCSDSAKAAENHDDKSVFFAFIDAGHKEAQVLADIEAWKPKIAPGGYLAGHDVYHRNHPGVLSALRKSGLDWRRVSKSSWIVNL